MRLLEMTIRNLLKGALCGIVLSAILSFAPKEAEACSSAIPSGRGYTNVAVAEDASAVYWNPAGLVQLERPELDMTLSPNNRYKEFVCYAQPLDDKSAFGVNYSHRHIDVDDGLEEDAYWIIGSYSRKLNEKLFVGGNLMVCRNYINDEPFVYNGKSDFFSIDLGFLYKPNEKMSIGLLVQQSIYGRNKFNIRPGLSYKFDDKTFFTVEGYDATSAFINSSWFRSGIERKVDDRLSLRAGIQIGDSVVPSVGVSFRKDDLETSLAYLDDEGEPHYILTLNKKF
jgi:long-subunit fatty acid transport protein